MQTPGQNDIVARLILEDQTSRPAKDAAKAVDKATTSMEKSGTKAKSVFDKMNFSLNLTGLAMKGFKAVIARNDQLQDDFNTTMDYFVGVVRQAADALMVLSGASGGWRQLMKDLGAQNAKANVEALNAEMAKLQEYLSGPRVEGGLYEILMNEGLSKSDIVATIRGVSDALAKSADDAKKLQDLIEIGLSKKTAESLIKAARDFKSTIYLTDEQMHEAAKAADEWAASQDDLTDSFERSMAAYERTFAGGFRRQTRDAREEFEVLGSIGAKTASDLQSNFSNNFFAVMRQEFTSFRDFGESVFRSLVESIQRQLADFAASRLLSSLGGIFANAAVSGGATGGGNLPLGTPQTSPFVPSAGYNSSGSFFGGGSGSAGSYAADPINVNISITAMDGESVERVLNSQRGRNTIANVMDQAIATRAATRRNFGK